MQTVAKQIRRLRKRARLLGVHRARGFRRHLRAAVDYLADGRPGWAWDELAAAEELLDWWGAGAVLVLAGN